MAPKKQPTKKALKTPAAKKGKPMDTKKKKAHEIVKPLKRTAPLNAKQLLKMCNPETNELRFTMDYSFDFFLQDGVTQRIQKDIVATVCPIGYEIVGPVSYTPNAVKKTNLQLLFTCVVKPATDIEVTVPVYQEAEIPAAVPTETGVTDTPPVAAAIAAPQDVSATITTTDDKQTVTFTATSWFENADTEQLLDLAHDDWTSIAAEEVAHYVKKDLIAVGEVIAYADETDDVEYTVTVNKAEAMEWLKQNRTTIYDTLVEIAKEDEANAKA